MSAGGGAGAGALGGAVLHPGGGPGVAQCGDPGGAGRGGAVGEGGETGPGQCAYRAAG